MKPLTQNRGMQGVHPNFAALTLNPSPKRERDFEPGSPSPKREKGLGDKGCKIGILSIQSLSFRAQDC